jgi:hypothetical protein
LKSFDILISAETFYAITDNSAARSYLYSTCTEQGAYQVAPASGPSLILNTLQANYTQQWCTWAFPPGLTNTITSEPNLTWYNHYGNLNLTAPRLALIDGNTDVWKDVCYHSDDGPQRYGPDQYLIAGGGHHWDSYGILDIDAEPDFIKAAHQWEIREVNKWLAEWDDQTKRKVKRDEL